MDVIFLDRRMFPTVRCSFLNLRPDQRYWVLLDIVPCDNKRYRYAYHRSSWLVAGKADPPPPHRLYTHPDSPFTGDQLRKQVVSFEKVKLTNNEMDKNGQVRCWVRFCHTYTHTHQGESIFLNTFLIEEKLTHLIIIVFENHPKCRIFQFFNISHFLLY